MLLNVKWNIIKLLDKIIGEKLWYLELGKQFRDLTSKAQSTKGKINRFDFIKI